MRLCTAYRLLVASIVLSLSTGQPYMPTGGNYLLRNPVLNIMGKPIGQSRRITKPGFSSVGTTSGTIVPELEPEQTTRTLPLQPEPGTNQNLPVERSDVSTTRASALSTATPYQLPEDLVTPEARQAVVTTVAPNSDMYFKAPDMSIFTTAAPTKPPQQVTERTTTTPQTTTMIRLSRTDSTLVQANRLVTDKVPIAENEITKPTVGFNLDDVQRKNDKKNTEMGSIYYTAVDPSKKDGKKNKSDNKAVVVKGTVVEPKGSLSNMEAKRVYDNVLKAFNSAKKGMCFSPAELQKAFPRCKIMY